MSKKKPKCEHQSKSKDQLRLETIVLTARDCAMAIGVGVMSLGQALALVSVDPKGAASKIQMVAGQMISIAEGLTDVAEEIKEWDKARIITRVHKPLVSTTGEDL